MLYEKELKKFKVFDEELPDYIEALTQAIPNTNVPYKMKVAIAVSEVVRFASQFKKYISLWNTSLIPINSITVCLAKSGVGKDSSVRAVTKCFRDSYTKIDTIRIQQAKEKAIECAREEGLNDADQWSVYKQFYEAPMPLEVGISTPEGLVQYLDDISKETLGSGYVYSGEFSSELLSNVNVIDNVKILSEVYDEGIKSMKALKDKTKQTEIEDVIANALFMSSQDTILYNEAVKAKFKNEFSTKLARRSFFVFVESPDFKEEVTDIYKLISEDRERENKANEVRASLNEFTLKLTEELLESIGVPITVDPKVEILFDLYKRYNEAEADKVSIQFPIHEIARTHMQWKALKLAGAFAIMDNSKSIQEHHYVYAIRYVELIANDINNFEKELVKEPYELFVKYMQKAAVDDTSTISLHTLRKLSYIPMKGTPTVKMKELVQLANSYDIDGDYSIDDDSITYKKINKTEEIMLSYIEVSGSKEDRARKCSKGFISEKYLFENLGELLKGNFAYSPFKFREGKRGSDYIESGCKWLVLDIDNSEINDEEAHFLLNGINHFIVRTSDPTNAFKFRVLLELDAEIDLNQIQWTIFLKIVAEELGLKIDVLPKSQIFFSYSESADSTLQELDTKPLEVKPILNKLQQVMMNGPSPVRSLPKSRKRELLDNTLETFNYAFNCKPGKRSISLIRAARHAKDLGATKEEVIELMNNINDYWVHPLDKDRFDTTVIRQISRWSF